MRSRIVIIIFITLSTIISSGCLNENIRNNKNNKEVKHYEQGDLILTLKADKTKYLINNSEINIQAILKNVAERNICVPDGFTIGYWDYILKIKTPSNKSYEFIVQREDVTVLSEYLNGSKESITIIKPDEELVYEFNLKNVQFLNYSQLMINNETNEYRWNETGKHSLVMNIEWCQLKSNELIFELI